MKKILLVGIIISFIAGFSGYIEAGKALYPENYDLKEHESRGYDCTECHDNKTDLKPPNHDEMFKREHYNYTKRQLCSACHSSSYCIDCHKDTQKLSRIKGAVSEKVVIHENAWIERHNIIAFKNQFRCLNCHDRNHCLDCHTNVEISTWNLQKFHDERSEIKPVDHDGAFIRNHRSKTKRQVCSACHNTQYCIDCHYNPQKLSTIMGEQTDRIMTHQGNWINRHGIKAQTNNFRCISCHDTAYCSNCHARSGIASWNYSDTSISIHPPGWRNRNSSNFHGRHARNNIVVCASCHESKDKKSNPDCVGCHQFINPHPSNWSDHDYDSETCKVCHGNQSGANSVMTGKRAKKAPDTLKK